MEKKQLEADFHHAMLEIYDLAKKVPTPYRATRFKQMVDEMGGKAAADKLLASPDISQGLGELYLAGQEKGLKISMEYLILQERWSPLFTEEQKSIARKKLKQCGLDV